MAASPQYIDELREEVIDLTSTGDWSKAAIDRMRKLDSFVRETQRISGIQNGKFILFLTYQAESHTFDYFSVYGSYGDGRFLFLERRTCA
jgi:hypothetical protein